MRALVTQHAVRFPARGILGRSRYPCALVACVEFSHLLEVKSEPSERVAKKYGGHPILQRITTQATVRASSMAQVIFSRFVVML